MLPPLPSFHLSFNTISFTLFNISSLSFPPLHSQSLPFSFFCLPPLTNIIILILPLCIQYSLLFAKCVCSTGDCECSLSVFAFFKKRGKTLSRQRERCWGCKKTKSCWCSDKRQPAFDLLFRLLLVCLSLSLNLALSVTWSFSCIFSAPPPPHPPHTHILMQQVCVLVRVINSWFIWIALEVQFLSEQVRYLKPRNSERTLPSLKLETNTHSQLAGYGHQFISALFLSCCGAALVCVQNWVRESINTIKLLWL